MTETNSQKKPAACIPTIPLTTGFDDLKLILNRIIATASFNSPSPKIIEWIFGNFFLLIRESIDTVSVAVNVADNNSTYYNTIGIIKTLKLKDFTE